MPANDQAAAQRYRYNVAFSVDATKEEAEGLAVAVVNAVDCRHVGAIIVSPGTTFSWEAEEDA